MEHSFLPKQVKKFPTFYGTESLLALFTTAFLLPLSSARLTQSTIPNFKECEISLLCSQEHTTCITMSQINQVHAPNPII